MKKQIIAAAVAATMSAVALADVSISGAAQVNWKGTSEVAGVAQSMSHAITHDVDLKVVGKSGDTSFTIDMEDTGADATGADSLKMKNLYMNTSIAGVDAKIGTWFNGDSDLNNAGQQNARAQFSTNVGPAKVMFVHEASTGNDHNEIHVGADIAGLKVSYEQENTDAHKILGVKGSIGGVNFAYTDSNSDNTSGTKIGGGAAGNDATTSNDFEDVGSLDSNDERAYSISADVAGMTIMYHNMESAAGTTSDGFFGTFANANLVEASGFGIKTNVAGNTVQVRQYETTVEGTSTDTGEGTAPAASDSTKVIVTRQLASGATAEVTYLTGDIEQSLDVEFRIAF